jgi:hypothetical protein
MAFIRKKRKPKRKDRNIKGVREIPEAFMATISLFAESFPQSIKFAQRTPIGIVIANVAGR